MKCVIFDIDGTLSDPTHRLHYVTNGNKRWNEFFSGMGADGCHQDIADLLKTMMARYSIILCSGRPKNYSTETRRWLQEHNILYDALYMRPEGDYRPDHVVKLELLAKMREDGWNPSLVIDDRPSVVAAWREAGLTCLQCRDWNEDQSGGDTPTATLTLMVGPSGAGKSSFLEGEWSCSGKNGTLWDDGALWRSEREIISSDTMRQDLCGDWRDQSKNDAVFAALHALVKTRLAHGLPCVIDATNLKRRDRLANVALQKPGGPVRYVVIDRPLEEKLRDRGWRSEELVWRHDQTFRSQLKDILAGDGLPNVEVIDLRKV